MSASSYAYYPGCALQGTAREYDVSTRQVCRRLDIELQELKEWACCGASSAHSLDRRLAVALPARELAIAEATGLPLVVACAMCYSRLRFAAHELEDEAKLREISSLIERECKNTTQVWHLLQVLDARDIPIARPLRGLRVACYYGCLLVRPTDITHFDDEDNPQVMDGLMHRAGAETVEWAFKTECCGAGMPFARRDIVLKLSHRILAQARGAGADCLAVACPMCHSNLDMQQLNMKSVFKDDFQIPVLYFTQLLGLALGFSPKELHINKHFVDAMPLLRGKGLA
ncbi:MAG TPA: heterodisulfide reductase subunit B [Dehalococcoidia bacterium]|jgi:heterodisulfide reductase subunit B|nr:heterodisulfide reductase subunit B [Dehalococcoidia bacterium]